MENAFSYVTDRDTYRMQGGDGRYNRMAADRFFKTANPDLELETKTRRVTDKVSECMNIVANEPSLAFFRIQEHVRKCLPQLVETKHEVEEIQQSVQGTCFDTEYDTNAVKEMKKSTIHFQNIQDLLKNAMFMKQQIDYEHARREQEKVRPSMYTAATDPLSPTEADNSNKPFQSATNEVVTEAVEGPTETTEPVANTTIQ